MSLDFDLDPVDPKEPTLINGRLCRWVPDPEDRMFGGKWDPVDDGPLILPNHKAARDPVLAQIRARESEFRKRTDDWLVAKGCTVYYRVDRYSHHAQRTFDLYGLFDREGCRPHPEFPGTEQTFMVQFTSRNNLGTHISKMCAHEPVSKSDKTWRVDYLLRIIDVGRIPVLLGFYKDGARWAVEERYLTREIVLAHEPRRKKPR